MCLFAYFVHVIPSAIKACKKGREHRKIYCKFRLNIIYGESLKNVGGVFVLTEL